jgi:hypothetical protein
MWLALVSICEIDVTSFSEDGRVLNGYVTNPNPTPTLTPNHNTNSNPNQINEKIQKETTLEIDQITKCQFGRWKLVKTESCAKPGATRINILISNKL